jgi:hypothetical protein
MGQQIPFETLDSVAHGLKRAAESEYQTSVGVDRADSEATTCLAAHIEYWLGTTIYAAMLSGIDGKQFPRP